MFNRKKSATTTAKTTVAGVALRTAGFVVGAVVGFAVGLLGLLDASDR